MALPITELAVLRDAGGAIDEQWLVLGVGELQPGWLELERYSGPLRPQAVRALEVATELVATESGRTPQ
jgi:hypothetical protein